MKWFNDRLAIFLVFLVLGPAAVAEEFLSPQDAYEHVLMVNKRGQYMDPAKRWDLFPKGKAPAKMSADGNLELIRSGIEHFCQTNAGRDLRIVVFVHGGLNSYSNSKERLENFLRLGMLRDGFYPILVVWNSGFFDSYAEHLVSIRQGEIRPILGKITAPVVFLADIGRGLVRLPLTLTGRIYNDIRTSEVPHVWDDQTRSWEDLEANLTDWQADEGFTLIRAPLKEDEIRGWGERSFRLASYIITQPTKIGLLPLADGFGTEAWDNMIRRTKTMFQPPATYDFPQRYREELWDKRVSEAERKKNVAAWMDRMPLIGKTNVSADGTMYQFAKALERWTTNHEFQCELKWDFYGHSMGTIVLNELFRVAPDIQSHRVAYMAAACSIRSFQENLVPYLRRQELIHSNSVPFFNLCLHRIRERDNSMDKIDLIPRGTLLNYVDDLFSRPETVTDRTLGSWENVIRALPDMPKDVRPRLHNICFDLLPWSFSRSNTNQPQNHSSFAADFRFWEDAFIKGPQPQKEPQPAAPNIRQSPALR